MESCVSHTNLPEVKVNDYEKQRRIRIAQNKKMRDELITPLDLTPKSAKSSKYQDGYWLSTGDISFIISCRIRYHTLYHLISCHVTYPIISYHISSHMSYDTISYDIISYHISHHIIHLIVSHHISYYTQHRIMPYIASYEIIYHVM